MNSDFMAKVKVALKQKGNPDSVRKIMSKYGTVLSDFGNMFYTLEANDNYSEGSLRKDLHKSGFYTNSFR